MKILAALLFVYLLFAWSPPTIHSTPVVSCHCFQDRQFDPAEPAAADSYFLATTQNSLLSVAYRIPKRAIVESKMGGTGGDLLWVYYSLAKHFSVSVEDIDSAWSELQDWSKVLSGLSLSSGIKIQPLPESRNVLKTTSAFADALAHQLLREQLMIAQVDIDQMTSAGASRKELILSILLHTRLDRSITSIWASIKNKTSTWGSLLFEAEISPKEIAIEWQRLLTATQG